MNISRLEALSDGAIAVAITLLALDIHVPSAGLGRSGTELASQRPQYAAYAVARATIGIIWFNHHWMISRLAQTHRNDPLLQHLLLLMFTCLLLFGTSLMSEYLLGPSGRVSRWPPRSTPGCYC